MKSLKLMAFCMLILASKMTFASTTDDFTKRYSQREAEPLWARMFFIDEQLFNRLIDRECNATEQAEILLQNEKIRRYLFSRGFEISGFLSAIDGRTLDYDLRDEQALTIIKYPLLCKIGKAETPECLLTLKSGTTLYFDTEKTPSGIAFSPVAQKRDETVESSIILLKSPVPKKYALVVNDSL